MKKILKLECPNCKAILEFTEKRNNMFCQYCGTKILLDDDNEFTYREINEAQIKEAELKHSLEMKKLEIKEKHYEEDKKVTKILIIASLIGGLISLIFLIIAASSGDDDHFGYLIFLAIAVAIGWMWIGKSIASEAKKDKIDKEVEDIEEDEL